MWKIKIELFRPTARIFLIVFLAIRSSVCAKMKLRIRSLGTQETQRIEVTVPCSLLRLKELISLAFSSSSAPLPAESIRISLNRKDEIQSSSPDEDTLQSLGITSGDLVFFTVNPNGFSSRTLITNSHQCQEPTSIINPQQNPVIPVSEMSLPTKANQPESANKDDQTKEIVQDEMEVDDINEEGSTFSAPSFLKNVFSAELDMVDGGENHKLLIVAIHAVLLESGFIGFDMDSKNEVEGFQFRDNWPQNMFLSLFYTLPGIINQVYPNSEAQNGVVVLKFQITGNIVNVYGSLYSASTRTYSLRLNEDYLVPFLNVVWANCGLSEKIASKDGISFTSPEIEVFNFWRNVKDDLALPLLIDLCDRAGFVLPPCFMRLPTDLKLKILESLPGDDIAKVSCVCSELRYLTSNDDLWKLKFAEEFDDDIGSLNEKGIWKSKFVRRWQCRKKKRSGSRFMFRDPGRMIFDPPTRFRQLIDPRTGLASGRGIIGGDYDLWPQNIPPFYQIGRRHMSRSHIPQI